MKRVINRQGRSALTRQQRGIRAEIIRRVKKTHRYKGINNPPDFYHFQHYGTGTPGETVADLQANQIFYRASQAHAAKVLSSARRKWRAKGRAAAKARAGLSKQERSTHAKVVKAVRRHQGQGHPVAQAIYSRAKSRAMATLLRAKKK